MNNEEAIIDSRHIAESKQTEVSSEEQAKAETKEATNFENNKLQESIVQKKKNKCEKVLYMLIALVVLFVVFFIGGCFSSGSEKPDNKGTKIDTLLEQLKLESEKSPKSVSPQSIFLSADLSFFEVKGNVKNIAWEKSVWDNEENAMGSPSSTYYEFNRNGILTKFDDYDAFVEEREKIEDLPDFKLGFFRGDDGYICTQSFSGAMSSYALYQWQNQYVNIETEICQPTGEETIRTKKYDDKGRLVSDICMVCDYPDTTNVLDRYTIEYTYIKVDERSNWIERKGCVDGKLHIIETRKIDYYK